MSCFAFAGTTTWQLNNNNIEFYWNHFVHGSLNNKCIYLDLKWLYNQNYMLYEKKVRSDKILFGLTKSRILSDQCLTKLWSISTALTKFVIYSFFMDHTNSLWFMFQSNFIYKCVPKTPSTSDNVYYVSIYCPIYLMKTIRQTGDLGHKTIHP